MNLAGMKISVVSDGDGFDALQSDWNNLLERARTASVFLSWDWMRTWWRHFGLGQRLHVLAAWQGETIVGILPVYVQTTSVMGVVPVRLLRFVGTGGDTAPDDLDALLDPSRAAEAARELASHAARSRGEWDVLHLTDLATGSEFRRALQDELSARPPIAFAEGVSARISYARLPASWEAYIAAQSRNRRYTIRRARRRLRDQPGSRLFVWDDTAALDIAVRRLAELHILRWRGRAEQYSFSSPAYLAFHGELMRRYGEKGWLRLYCLELNGAIEAMTYCYRFRDHVSYFQSGFDPAISKLSPGLVLMGFAIEHAIGEGNKVFEMLRGEYEYKTKWAPERRETHFIQAYRRSLGAFAYRVRHNWLPAAVRRIVGRREGIRNPGEVRGAVAGFVQRLVASWRKNAVDSSKFYSPVIVGPADSGLAATMLWAAMNQAAPDWEWNDFRVRAVALLDEMLVFLRATEGAMANVLGA